jgi:hypothetical protein
MVLEVPLAGEAVSRNTALASFILAQERLVTMTMETMGLTLVAKQASGGREPGTLAGLGLAAVRLQVGVHEFAGSVSDGSISREEEEIGWVDILIVALELLRAVIAASLTLPGTVIETILLRGGVLVQFMVPGSLAIPAGSKSGRQAEVVTKRGNGSYQILRHLILNVNATGS